MTDGAPSQVAQPTMPIPVEFVDAVADRLAARLLPQLAARLDQPSPWLDFEAARVYLGFTRDRLYKLTAAKAIPFHKKEGGQGLLFHRDELDAWLKAAYPRQDRW